MIFIAVKFTVRPEHSEHWLNSLSGFTTATRAEAGNLWFEWSRNVEDPDEFVLLEAFRDGDAGAEHVSSEHFKNATQQMPAMLVKTPQVVNFEVPGTEWSALAEVTVEE